MDNVTEKIRSVLWSDFMKGIYLVGVIAGVITFITGPQSQQYIAIEILKEQVKNQQITIDTITKTQQNDTQEVKKGLDETKRDVSSLNDSIIRLETIINERIPKR